VAADTLKLVVAAAEVARPLGRVAIQYQAQFLVAKLLRPELKETEETGGLPAALDQEKEVAQEVGGQQEAEQETAVVVTEEEPTVRQVARVVLAAQQETALERDQHQQEYLLVHRLVNLAAHSPRPEQ